MSQNLLVSMLVRLRDELSRPAQRMLQGVTRDAQTATQSVRGVADASARSAQQRADQVSQAEHAVQGEIARTGNVQQRAAQAAAQSQQIVQREVGRTAAAYGQEARAAQTAADTATRATDAALAKRLREYQRFNRAWEAIGIRSEAEIQREIDRTEAAYARLARSGLMSAEEQARAFEQTRTRVAELNAEMGKLEQRGSKMSFLQAGAGGVVRAGEAMLGGIAAAHAVAAPMRKTMSFDQNVALAVNTAFNEEDDAGRTRGEKTVRDAVRASVQAGGGDANEVLAAMTQLLGQNAVSHETAFKLMPVLQRYATGEGADTTELANIATRGIQTFGMKESEIPQVLDASIMGGHMGGVHLRQMAKYLPQQMAAARNAGMSGMKGFTELIALNEVSLTTAGTADEAGNNALDLLNKLNSADTAHAVKRELGGTLAVKLAKKRMQGESALVAFGDILEEVMAKDKNYQNVKKRFAAAKNDDERKEALGSMEQIFAGSAISKIVRNRQEMLALMGFLGNREKFNEIATKTMHAHEEGIGEKDIREMQRQDGWKAERAKSLGEIGEMDAMRGLDKIVGNVSDKISEYATKYPGLISAIMGTKVAFEGLTSVLMAVGMMRMLTGHGGRAAVREAEHLAVRAGGKAAVRAAADTPAMARAAQAAGRVTARALNAVPGVRAVRAIAGSRFMQLAGAAGQGAGRLGRFLKPAGSSALSLIAGGIEAYGISQDDKLNARQKKSEYTRVAGGTAGGIGGWMAGAAAGAAIGSVVPVIGTAVGGAIGGLAGGLGGDMLGEKLGKWIGDALFKAESNKPPQQINIKTQLTLDRQVIAETVNQVNAKTALRS
ncbi:phage tail tape measure protein [Burkholderia pyrrocinia]|uniref:phage tail tape measure protein n=1 Tax=Burkholderia pyrrocinia TaxID=60550 RepID=UPI00158C93C9|nr:phage tail tape measure protein [Burkholderia pyrrocinia]